MGRFAKFDDPLPLPGLGHDDYTRPGVEHYWQEGQEDE